MRRTSAAMNHRKSLSRIGRERLLLLFSLHPDGRLFWNRRPRSDFGSQQAFSMWNTRYAGIPAGRVRSYPYRTVIIRIDGDSYLAHRIIFYISTGLEPVEIDHKNGDSLDNRPSNLRAASSSQNHCNRGAQSNNKLGLKDVHRNGTGFSAQIRFEGKKKHLGTFKTPEDAHEAYKNAVREMHGEFARVT